MAQINKANEYFNTVLYTGNDTGQSITGVGFQPDWVWIKDRDGTERHVLNDVVRGVFKELRSNETSAESDRSSFGGLSSFDSDGFTIGNDDGYNDASSSQVSWNWKAGGTASSNTDGTITSSVSASTTSGFSIATYTGNGTGSATFGHGLGSVPQFVIVKRRDVGDGWQCWGSQFTRLVLNGTNADLGNFPITRSSTLITLPSTVDTAWNTSGGSYVSYCFAEKKGFSKFGSYVGNGSTDGNFVYLGFKPAFVLVKNSSLGGENWVTLDNKRDTKNPTNLALFLNLSNAESGTYPFDFVSNGFKIRDSSASYNRSGDTFIYMAFAENPLVGTNGVPATAR